MAAMKDPGQVGQRKAPKEVSQLGSVRVEEKRVRVTRVGLVLNDVFMAMLNTDQGDRTLQVKMKAAEEMMLGKGLVVEWCRIKTSGSQAIRIGHLEAIRWYLGHNHVRTTSRSAACPCKLQKVDDEMRERFFQDVWARVEAESRALMERLAVKRAHPEDPTPLERAAKKPRTVTKSAPTLDSAMPLQSGPPAYGGRALADALGAAGQAAAGDRKTWYATHQAEGAEAERRRSESRSGAGAGKDGGAVLRSNRRGPRVSELEGGEIVAQPEQENEEWETRQSAGLGGRVSAGGAAQSEGSGGSSRTNYGVGYGEADDSKESRGSAATETGAKAAETAEHKASAGAVGAGGETSRAGGEIDRSICGDVGGPGLASGDGVAPFADQAANIPWDSFSPGMSPVTPASKGGRTSFGTGKENMAPRRSARSAQRAVRRISNQGTTQAEEPGRRDEGSGGALQVIERHSEAKDLSLVAKLAEGAGLKNPGSVCSEAEEKRLLEAGFRAGTSPGHPSPPARRTSEANRAGSGAAKKGGRKRSGTSPPQNLVLKLAAEPVAGLAIFIAGFTQSWTAMMRDAPDCVRAYHKKKEQELLAGLAGGALPHRGGERAEAVIAAECETTPRSEAEEQQQTELEEVASKGMGSLNTGPGVAATVEAGGVLRESPRTSWAEEMGDGLATTPSALEVAVLSDRPDSDDVHREVAVLGEREEPLEEKEAPEGAKMAGGGSAAGFGRQALEVKLGSGKAGPKGKAKVGDVGREDEAKEREKKDEGWKAEELAMKDEDEKTRKGGGSKTSRETERATDQAAPEKEEAHGEKRAAKQKDENGEEKRAGRKGEEKPRGERGKEATGADGGSRLLAEKMELEKSQRKVGKGKSGESVVVRRARSVGKSKALPQQEGAVTTGVDAARRVSGAKAGGNPKARSREASERKEPALTGKPAEAAGGSVTSAGGEKQGHTADGGPAGATGEKRPGMLGEEPGVHSGSAEEYAARAIGDSALIALPSVRVAPSGGRPDDDSVARGAGSSQQESGSSGAFSPTSPLTEEQVLLMARHHGAHARFLADEDTGRKWRLVREYMIGMGLPVHPQSLTSLGPLKYAVKDCAATFNTVCHKLCILLAEAPRHAEPALRQKAAEAAREAGMADSWRAHFSAATKKWFDRDSKGNYKRCPDTLFDASKNLRHLEAHQVFNYLLEKARGSDSPTTFTWAETYVRKVGPRYAYFLYLLFHKLSPGDLKAEARGTLDGKRSADLHASVRRLEDMFAVGDMGTYVQWLRIQRFAHPEME